MALLGFSYHLMPRHDSNPQQTCTRLGPMKDALSTELQCRGYNGAQLVNLDFSEFNPELLTEVVMILVWSRSTAT